MPAIVIAPCYLCAHLFPFSYSSRGQGQSAPLGLSSSLVARRSSSVILFPSGVVVNHFSNFLCLRRVLHHRMLWRQLCQKSLMLIALILSELRRVSVGCHPQRSAFLLLSICSSQDCD